MRQDCTYQALDFLIDLSSHPKEVPVCITRQSIIDRLKQIGTGAVEPEVIEGFTCPTLVLKKICPEVVQPVLLICRVISALLRESGGIPLDNMSLTDVVNRWFINVVRQQVRSLGVADGGDGGNTSGGRLAVPSRHVLTGWQLPCHSCLNEGGWACVRRHGDC